MPPGQRAAGPQPFDGALEHHLAALGAGAGAEIDDVVGDRDRLRLVLHDQHGVALVAQLQLSTLDLSGELKLAKEERARATPEPKAKDMADMSVAERLDMLSDEVAKRLEAEAAPERAAREEEARRRALDVAQQQDLEHGRGRSRGRSIGDDDDELKRKLDRGKDFGLER